MLCQALEPTLVTYSAVISACEKGQELRRAFDVCAVMLRQALQPNIASYRTSISASANDQELRRAIDVCAEMLRQALEPGMVSYNAMISSWGKGPGVASGARRLCGDAA